MAATKSTVINPLITRLLPLGGEKSVLIDEIILVPPVDCCGSQDIKRPEVKISSGLVFQSIVLIDFIFCASVHCFNIQADKFLQSFSCVRFQGSFQGTIGQGFHIGFKSTQ